VTSRRTVDARSQGTEGGAGTLDDLNAEKSYRAFSAHMNTVAGNEVLVLDAAARYPQATVLLRLDQ
jgi:hypothetical protein